MEDKFVVIIVVALMLTIICIIFQVKVSIKIKEIADENSDSSITVLLKMMGGCFVVGGITVILLYLFENLYLN